MFRELVRKNTQISTEECVEVLKQETRGVLSVLGDDDYPYGMPMNHWYNEEDGAVYFHCGKFGHRLDALKRHNKVSFCVHDQGYRNEGDWAWHVKSVILFGRMEFIEDMDTIVRISTQLSYKFTRDEDYIRQEIEKHAHKTLLMRLVPEHMCGRLVKES